MHTTSTVAAAFAQERDATYAIRLMASVSDHAIRYTLRNVVGERGEIQMVILEATTTDPSLASRLETAMTGAHGVLVPTDVLAGQTVARAAQAS